MKTLTRLAVLAFLAGCSTTPRYDPHFGEAVRQAKLAMTINPNAGANPNSVAGMDGQAATEAMARYQNSFKEPPPPMNVINIGGVAGTTK